MTEKWVGGLETKPKPNSNDSGSSLFSSLENFYDLHGRNVSFHPFLRLQYLILSLVP